MSAPTLTEIQAAFPNQFLPKIIGEPTYTTLNDAKERLLVNATSIESSLGGGENGHSGLIFSAEDYEEISDIPFIIPNRPPKLPEVPEAKDATANERANIVRAHKNSVYTYQTCANVHAALKKQLADSMDPIYLKAVYNKKSGFQKTTLQKNATASVRKSQHNQRSRPR